jgi:cytochrome c oxidase subunit II
MIPAFVHLATLLANALGPQTSDSPNAHDIHRLYVIVEIVAIPIFLLVEGTLLYSLFKFRARRRGGREPVQIHGNAPLELGWTVGAALIVVALATVTFIFLPRIENPARSEPTALARAAGQDYAVGGQPAPPGGKSLQIHVNGQQYIWRFDYVGEKPLTEGRPVYAYYQMVVPTGTTVILHINSSDVAHSWWIPKLGGKADAIPGHTNETWFRISTPGIYRGNCAELCGENHADMRASVRALPPDQFRAWITQQRNNILAAQQGLAAMRKAGIGNPLPKGS